MNKNRNGWKQVKLRELTSKIGSGITPRGGSEVYQDKGIIFLRSQNIQDGCLSLNDVAYLSDSIDSTMASSRVKENDVLYNITGASIGRSAIYTGEDLANVNQHVCIIRLKNDNPKFINYFLLSHVGKTQLDGFQAGGNRQGLNYQQLGSFRLDLPSLAEQNRIVAVLETWDKAIEKLKNKIEIKKTMQKGLMQELLTGKTRLPGFNENWENLEFADLFEVLKKPKGLKSDEYFEIGIYPIIDQSKDKLISGYTNNKEYVHNFCNKAIVVFGDHSRVIKYIDFSVGFGNDGIKAFMAKNCLDIKFGYYLLLNYRIPETGYNRHFKYLEIGIFNIPHIREQSIIAKILTSADNELESLNKKLSLLQDQKKYLLNNLITGNIRTPEALC